VVGGDRGHAAPVVDPRVQQGAEVVGQVRRRLHVHVAGQDHPGQRDRLDEVLVRARRVVAHRRAGLGQEVLDDDLLHVPVPGVGGGDRLQRLDPVRPVLADADEDPRGERDLQLARPLERRQPAARVLVRRAPVARQVGAQGLEHHPLGGAHLAQPREVLAPQRPGVGVRQQARLLQDQAAHRHQVVDRRRVAALGEPLAGDVVLLLGGLAEGEQRLVAARPGALQRDLPDLLRFQERRLQAPRRLGERAVPAAVAAQLRERDEDLRREGHARAPQGIAPGGGLREQVAEGRGERHGGLPL